MYITVMFGSEDFIIVYSRETVFFMIVCPSSYNFAAFFLKKNEKCFFVDLTDGYTTKDIIYEWGPGGVVVGNNEMAQFEYKGNNISSDIDVFSVGKKYFQVLR